MTTFRQIVSKIQDGLLEEAKVGLDFVLRLDPTFAPGLELQRQLSAGQASIDLTALISHLDAPSSATINILLVEAVEEFNQRNYLEAKEKVSKVLLDLPGHAEARNLLGQIEESLKTETQVGQFLTQAREAIDRGDPEEAANFVMMAQALDPHHRGIQGMLVKLQSSPEPTLEPAAEPPPSQPGPVEQDRPDARATVPAEPQKPVEAVAAKGEDPGSDEDSWNIANAFSVDESGADAGVDPPPPTPVPSDDSDIADLFEVEESGEDVAPAADPADPEIFVAAAPPPPVEGDGPAFDDSSGDLGDLFQSDPDIGDQFALESDADATVDPVDVRETQIRAMVEQATAAWEGGDASRARDLVEGVLSTDPGHGEALDLIAQIDAAEEAAIVPDSILSDGPAAQNLEAESPDEQGSGSDLYAKEFAPPEPVDATRMLDDSAPSQQPESAPRARSASKSPLRLVVLAAAGVAIVLATMWLGRGFFSGEGDAEEQRAQAVTQVLQEAETFFKQGKTEEALHLLQSFPAEGLEKQRIDKRIDRYQESLAPPPPTPIPEAFVNGRRLIDQGLWFDAYGVVAGGLRTNPDDPGLRALRDEIADIQPDVVPLFSSLNNNDFATAASLSSDLEKQHSDQPGLSVTHERCLFNAALMDLRSYNLVGARNYLEALKARQPQDPELARILDFISTYSNRSVDMQLEIFVGSLEER